MNLGKIKTIRTGFHPTGSLDGKQNYKKFLRIERDGSVVERVFLDVPDVRHREELICLHYLRFLAQNIFDEDIGVNVLERDDPWDFKLELSNSMKFNLEITAIADSDEHFRINKREERLAYWREQEKIPFHELKKLGSLFPDDELAETIKEFENGGISNEEEINNPLNNPNMHIMISSMLEPTKRLEDLIKTAIDKKCSKNHSEKENTVLIIDNRTSFFDISDYQEAVPNIEEYLQNAPFKEIWFYTGFCSDNDGNNAEFIFAPLKIPENYDNKISDLAEQHGVDDSGRVIV